MVLPTNCDEKYCLTYVEFGQYESTNDSSNPRSSGLYKAFEENKFNVPVPTEAKEFEDLLPYFFLWDEISPLKIWLRPFFSQSLELGFVFTTIYKQHNYRFILRKVSHTLKDLMDRSKRELEEYHKVSQYIKKFHKSKRGESIVSYHAKTIQSSLIAYLNSAVRQVEWQWDYVKVIVFLMKAIYIYQ